MVSRFATGYQFMKISCHDLPYVITHHNSPYNKLIISQTCLTASEKKALIFGVMSLN